jgi:hypothetical protein
LIHNTEHSDGPNGRLLVAELFGIRVAETILASAHVWAHQQAGHMDASNLIKTLPNILQVGARPHMGPNIVVALCGVNRGRQSLHKTAQELCYPNPRVRRRCCIVTDADGLRP